MKARHTRPHWIQKEHLFGEIEYVCSVCGDVFDEPWEVCPECGAKMRKVKFGPVFVDEAEMLDILFGDE